MNKERASQVELEMKWRCFFSKKLAGLAFLFLISLSAPSYASFTPSFTQINPSFVSPDAPLGDDESCDSYPDVSVEVAAVFGEINVDNKKNLGELQDLARKKENIIPEDQPMALGLTKYTPVFRLHSPVMRRRMSDGSFCARVQYVDVQIGFDEVIIYIAKEFKEESCSFKAIMGHEQKHIDLNRQILMEYVPKIKDRLVRYLKDNGVAIVSNEEYSEKILRDKIEGVAKGLLLEIARENENRQRIIDTPEEYERINSTCKAGVSKEVMDYYSVKGKRK